MTTYDAALSLVQQLTPAERRRLQHELATLEADDAEQPAAKRARTLAVLDQIDRLAADVAAEWTDDMNVVAAVHDVRRDL